MTCFCLLLRCNWLFPFAGARGRLHVSEIGDGEPGEGAQNPLERYPVGAALRAVVLEQASSRAVRSTVTMLLPLISLLLC